MTHTLPTNSKKGFTIIEVVLVLAIAGLIFLMVFVALPTLQTSQRDTQRKNDISTIASQLVSYVSNNNKLPTAGSIEVGLKNGSTVPTAAGTAASMQAFAYNYLLSAGSNKNFVDPTMGYYKITSVAAPTANGAVAMHTDLQASRTLGSIVVQYGASCNTGALEDKAFTKNANDGARSFAIAIRMESGSIYCTDN